MSHDDDRRWEGKSRGGSFGYRFFIFAVRHLGLRFSYWFLALIVVYFVPFAPKATSAVWFYNRSILGYGRIKSFRYLFIHYYRFGQTLIDKLAIAAGMEERFSFEFENYDSFLETLDSGKGVVLIGAHMGCWEAGATFFGGYESRMNIVLYDSEHGKIKEALEKNAGEHGFKVICVNEDGLASVLKIKKALDEGEYVCFQGDRFLDGENVIPAVFMGRETRFPRGPFLTASRMGAPVALYYAMREKGRTYKFYFRIIEPAVSDRRNKPEVGLLEQYVAATEEMVRRYPQQWFNFYKFWN